MSKIILNIFPYIIFIFLVVFGVRTMMNPTKSLKNLIEGLNFVLWVIAIIFGSYTIYFLFIS